MNPVWSKYSDDFLSRRITVVISLQSAETFPALDLSIFLSDFGTRIDDSVPQPLVIALPMIMSDELF